MKTYVFCSRISESAKVLCRSLRDIGVVAQRLRGLAPPKYPNRLIINWGCSQIPHLALEDHAQRVKNLPAHVGMAVSKFETLSILDAADIPVIKVTKEPDQALQWRTRGKSVLARKDGLSSGRGITLLTTLEDMPDGVDFYSRVYPKTHEFRIHILDGASIDFTQKKRIHERVGEAMGGLIRTHVNGWVFAHDDISLTDQRDIDTLIDVAKRSIRALGLDFGAVDILAILDTNNPRRLKSYKVCEINTAPGLENTRTIQAYAEGFKRMIRGNAP